jgi:hypothetical protein
LILLDYFNGATLLHNPTHKFPLRSSHGDRYVSDMSLLTSQQVARHLKQGRSRVTNGTRTLIGVKGSSKFGRRYRDIVDLYTTEIGGDLSQTEMAMVKQAAALAIKGEMMQAAIINGEPVDSDNLIRISSEVRRILDSLKSGKREPAAVPTIHDHAARRAAERGSTPSAERAKSAEGSD